MHSTSAEIVPILGNDAKTQGKPNDVGKTRHDRQPPKKATKPRRPHLVLKRTKSSGGSSVGQKRIPKRSDLVFLQPSPNYCEPDLAQGSLGTQGRYCNRTSKGDVYTIFDVRSFYLTKSFVVSNILNLDDRRND